MCATLFRVPASPRPRVPAGTRGRGDAGTRNRVAHIARLCSEGSLLLSDVPSVHAKMAKNALLTAARAGVSDRAAHAESSDSTRHLKHALFARVSRCVRSYR